MTIQEKKNPLAGKHWVIVLILLGSIYGIFTGIKNFWQLQKERERWTEADKKILTDNCIRDAKDMAIKYPDLTRKYCNCSNERILSRFSKPEYVDIMGKPMDEQKEILLPVFKDCLTQYQNDMRIRK